MSSKALPEQPYDYYVVLDFEATCDKGPWRNEIIEFPSVLVDAKTRKVVSEFQYYVKPERNPTLTDFCKELTGIQQEWVDKGHSIEKTLKDYEQWLFQNNLFDLESNAIRNPKPHPNPKIENERRNRVKYYSPSKYRERFAFVTCGDWDLKTMMHIQSQDSKFKIPGYFSGWVNLKRMYASDFKGWDGRHQLGMDGMLNDLGMQLIGRHHSGIDDCRNIARILIRMMEEGLVVNETTPRYV